MLYWQGLKKKLRAAAYTHKGVDIKAFFKFMDNDGSNELDYEEFKTALRKQGKMAASSTTDQQIREMFDAVDLDGGGTISIDELADFLFRKPGDPPPFNGIVIPEIIDQVRSSYIIPPA